MLLRRKEPNHGRVRRTNSTVWTRDCKSPRGTFEAVEFATQGKFIAVAGGDVWDLAVLGPDPARMKVADWSAPVLELDYTYLVGPNSKLINCDEVDRPGMKVGAVRGEGRLARACRLAYL